MAGRSKFTEEDKAKVFATLTANDGNIKRTARETGVAVSTVRRWREEFKTSPPDSVKVQAAVTEFVTDAERIRNLALDQLEDKINAGDVSARELVTTIGVLDDKITRHKGLPTQRTEHVNALPDREQLRELLGTFVQTAIQAAEERHEDIVDAEVVEAVPHALPPAPEIIEA